MKFSVQVSRSELWFGVRWNTVLRVDLDAEDLSALWDVRETTLQVGLVPGVQAVIQWRWRRVRWEVTA